MTVAGFQDSPVSWGKTESKVERDNLYSCVLFPDERDWLYKVGAPHKKKIMRETTED